MYTIYVPSVHGGQKTGFGSSGLELHMVVSCRVGLRNGTQCSYLLSFSVEEVLGMELRT